MKGRRPGARISSVKPGKLVAMKAASSTRDRLLAAEPHHQRRHRDPMIHVGRDHTAARRAALAVHDQVVAVDLHLDAVDAQHRGGGGEPVGFLDAQFLQAAHPRRALGERRGHREDRIFVDHRRRALRRHVDALQRARLAPADRRRPRRLRCAPSSISIDAPISLQRREQPGAQRIDHHAFEDDLGARHDQRRHQRKRRRRRIGRHHDRRGLKLGLAFERDAAAMLADRTSRGCCAPKCLSIFSVWSRVASFSITVVAPGAARPASSTADLSCADGTGASYSIGIGSRAPCSVTGSRPPSADLRGARAHLLQRIENAPHRPRAQARVAVEHHRDRAAGHRAHHQPAAGAGIAEIERRRGLGKAADADAPHAPGALAGALHGGAQRPHGLGGADDVLALQHAR